MVDFINLDIFSNHLMNPPLQNKIKKPAQAENRKNNEISEIKKTW